MEWNLNIPFLYQACSLHEKFQAISMVLLSLHSFRVPIWSSLVNVRNRQFLLFEQSTQTEETGDISAPSQNRCCYHSIQFLLLWLVVPLINYSFQHFDICVYLEAYEHINQNNKYLVINKISRITSGRLASQAYPIQAGNPVQVLSIFSWPLEQSHLSDIQ